MFSRRDVLKFFGVGSLNTAVPVANTIPTVTTIVYNNNKLFLENGVVVKDEWYDDGMLSCTTYYKNGKIHNRDNGLPAQVFEDGVKSWYENGVITKTVDNLGDVYKFKDGNMFMKECVNGDKIHFRSSGVETCYSDGSKEIIDNFGNKKKINKDGTIEHFKNEEKVSTEYSDGRKVENKDRFKTANDGHGLIFVPKEK